MKGRRLLIAVGVVWLCVVGAGLRVMLEYETTPGVAATAPIRWPADSEIRRLPARHTLILFAHPHCPCTRATIGELALLMARVQGKVSACVLFVKPKGVAEDWEQTDLWRSAAAIPGVIVLEDEDGVEAARFGANVSGQAALYDANGRLLFSGGITASRGHSGDNAGRSAIVSLLTAGTAQQAKTAVYGCSLHDPARGSLQAGSSWKK